MRIAQIGNFEPEFSTENELRDAMLRRGWDVDRFQEGDPDAATRLRNNLRHGEHDFVLWTSTRDLRERWGREFQRELLQIARNADVPTVAYHLDRWWGLKREHMLADDPYFRCDLVVTADGAHDNLWEGLGINHHWMPPGVSERWCKPGQPLYVYECDVVFVGSWQHYHREWPHRVKLVQKLSDWYGERFKVFPEPGKHAIRGLELNDVYWSAKVVVGDSCLVPKVNGSPMTNYCSDRIPETLGRGGILCHPHVDGVYGHDGAVFDPGADFGQFGWWNLYDWQQLRDLVDSLMDEPVGGRMENIAYIHGNHTYTVRMGQLEEALRQKEMI